MANVVGNHIGVIGIGKLGLCFALNLERVGYRVTGLDADAAYVAEVNARTLRSFEPQVETLLAASRNFTATTDWSEILVQDIELLFLVVATPSLPDAGYDHSQVDAVLERLAESGPSERMRHIVVMCTTMPGYCDSVAPKMAALNYTLSYNPEFIAQGTIVRDQQQPDQVLIGEASKDAGDAIEQVYRAMCSNVPTFCRMSRISAEIAKLATNCFLTTKISFANSIGDLATQVGAEPDKILAAIGADKRIGPRYLGYGFGYGGPCFPRDNRALAMFGRQSGMEVLLSQATDEVNRRHLDFQFEQYCAAFAESETIVFESVTYKPGTTILEESQQLALALRLAQAGRKVRVRDLPVVVAALQTLYGDLFDYES
ncbi:MAG TPA: nucleotide sugar dehydrogenase, partial [Bacteroidia bacterium]|nr:nucleotide sugar dehydrogenase [Bacteroidia bacterium]